MRRTIVLASAALASAVFALPKKAMPVGDVAVSAGYMTIDRRSGAVVATGEVEAVAAPFRMTSTRVVRDGDVYLFGGGTNGTRYAAYDFLQGVLGYRFFDARGGMFAPDLKTVVMTNCVRRRRFSFDDRYMSCWGRYSGAETAMFLFRHGISQDQSASVRVDIAVEIIRFLPIPVRIEEGTDRRIFVDISI